MENNDFDFLIKNFVFNNIDLIHEVNCHIHTPYSFSAFSSISEAARQANAEEVRLLGINDFYTVDGYDEFFDVTSRYKIFPLYNIEFTGLDKEYQKNGERVNDPNNPGRTYLCGKGLTYPVKNKKFLDSLKDLQEKNNQHSKKIINEANTFFNDNNIDITLDYNEILNKYAKKIVRERHIARAIKDAVFYMADNKEQRIEILTKIFQGVQVKSDIDNDAALENEIRNNLLKDDKPAFVQEDEDAFYSIEEIIKLIRLAGGIPCYPTLLGDTIDSCTEFEKDWDKMHKELSKLNIQCLELIPSRNNIDILVDFVKFFHQKKYIIMFGTEHNTPDKTSLKILAKNKTEIPAEIKRIAYEGARVVAAHQFLMENMNDGYLDKNGKNKSEEIDDFAGIGHLFINSFINKPTKITKKKNN